MIIHKDPDGEVIYVERISKWTEPQGNIYKKGTLFHSIPIKGFPILDNFYKTLGWKKWAVFPVVPFTPLNIKLGAQLIQLKIV